ncbi:unnamed protein product, partial [Didymodactylos carnosus]
MAKHRRF